MSLAPSIEIIDVTDHRDRDKREETSHFPIGHHCNQRSSPMRRSAIGIAVLCLSALSALSVSGQQGKEASRTFQFRYHTVVKEIPANAGKVEVWLPYPTSDAHQTIEKVVVDAPRP